MSDKLGESSRGPRAAETEGEVEVLSHDFANPEKLPSKRVKAPKTKEDWDHFITRYSLGEYTECHFDSDDSFPTSPGRPDPSLQTSEPVPPPISHFPSDKTITQDVSPSVNTSVPSPTPYPSRQNSFPFGKIPEATDYHPKVSRSGPSNQDPEIPNIGQGDSSDSSGPEIVSTDDDAGLQSKAPDAMTMENMGKLSLEQRDHRSKERENAKKPSEKGTRSITGKRRRRQGDHAELASVGRAVSADSSPDDEPGVILRPDAPRRRSVKQPKSRGSWSKRSRSPSGSILRGAGGGASLDAALLESGTNDSTSASAVELNYDHGQERARVREFYEEHGYMPAPRQSSEAARRRLRVIRRLGLENIDPLHRATLDRFTRLATTVFKTNVAVINIIGKDKQTFLSEIGIGKRSTGLDLSFCSHAVMMPETGHSCMVVDDLSHDWRFKNNPFVQNGTRFYAGAPLRIGSGSRSTVIGTLCVLHDEPRKFSEDDRALLVDLADCVVSEQASVESAKLHQISVDFLRRSLKHRPNERAGSRTTGTNDTGTGTGTSATSSNGKRNSGADQDQDQGSIDIYDEACREIRYALDAYAVSVVDLSQFHLFYPTYQNSSTGGGSSTKGSSTTGRGNSHGNGQTSTLRTGSTTSSTNHGQQGEDDSDAYAKPANVKRALPTYAVKDPMAPSRTPQVLYIPSRSKSTSTRKDYSDDAQSENLAVLGYSCSEANFAFNFSSSPAARRIISDFIASNVKTRRVWYTRDDSEGVAKSITHLMPPGTETSMAMPVFGFDGQVAFAVVACWTDPLYTYPAGALQFVETIAGSLLASVMKERLHQAERAQLHFAAAASHELRTPLHQINAAASILRSALHGVLEVPYHEGSLPPKMSMEDRIEALAQLEIIEVNGMSLGNILENIIDTLDIGKMASKIETAQLSTEGTPVPSDLLRPSSNTPTTNFAEVLESVVEDAMAMEAKSRRMTSGVGLDGIEVILEVLPRVRGGWRMTNDSGPLARSLGKVIHNAVKFTEKGHVHITVQDVSRDVVLPAGFDNSVKVSTVSIDIKDTGKGMSADFLDREVLRPFSKEDPFTSGSGLGLGLAQRMIELLGGKLAIASTLGKGTLVHIEVPIHLLNEDNDSDQDVMASNDASAQGVVEESIRQDGIFLPGWNESKDPTIRRVGKSLVRQLKLNFCRVVSEINYASLIVFPEGALKTAQLASLCRTARPGVQVFVLGEDHLIGGSISILDSPAQDEDDYLASLARAHAREERHQIQLASGHATSLNHSSASMSDPDVEYLRSIPIVFLSRPLRPSVLKRIMKPTEHIPHVPETYKSDVVGGDEAREEIQAEAQQASDDAQVKESAVAASAAIIGFPDLINPTSDADEASESPSSANAPQPQSHPRQQKPVQNQLLSPKSAGNTLSLPKFEFRSEENITSAGETTDTPGTATESSMTSDMISHHSAPSHGSASVTSDVSVSVQSDSSESSSHVHAPPLRQMRSGSEHTVRGAQTANGEPLKVLVVEDNAVNRKILTTMLKRTSCHFVEAADGFEAVSQFTSFHPDLVLLDITMPRKDGFAAAAEMRHFEATSPVDSGPQLEEAMEKLDMTGSSQENDSGTPSSDRLTPKSVSSSTSNSSSIHGKSGQAQSSSRPLSPISTTSSHSGLGTGVNKRAKIIAVTAMSAEHQRRKGLLESGIDMWMVKPIAMRELRGIVETMKEEKEREREGSRGGWSGSELSMEGRGSTS